MIMDYIKKYKHGDNVFFFPKSDKENHELREVKSA